MKCIMCSKGKKGACEDDCTTKLMVVSNPVYCDDDFNSLFEHFGRQFLWVIFTNLIAALPNETTANIERRIVNAKAFLMFELELWRADPVGGPLASYLARGNKPPFTVLTESDLKGFFCHKTIKKLCRGKTADEKQQIKRSLIWECDNWVKEPFVGPHMLLDPESSSGDEDEDDGEQYEDEDNGEADADEDDGEHEDEDNGEADADMSTMGKLMLETRRNLQWRRKLMLGRKPMLATRRNLHWRRELMLGTRRNLQWRRKLQRRSWQTLLLMSKPILIVPK